MNLKKGFGWSTKTLFFCARHPEHEVRKDPHAAKIKH